MILRTAMYKNTRLLNFLMLILCTVGGPVAVAILFIKWPDSPSRQIVGLAGLAGFFVLAFTRRKQNVFTLLTIFLSQFIVSLVSFNLQDPTTVPILLSDLLLLLLLFSFKEIGEKVRMNAFAWTYLALLALQIVLIGTSIHQSQSIVFVLFSTKALILYLIVSNLDFKERFYKTLPLVVIAIIVTQTLIAVVQYLKGGYVGLAVLGERDSARSVQFFFDGSLRASGTLGATNALGGYMSMLLVFLLPFIIAKKSLLYYGAFIIGLVGLYIPLARAGWLSFLLCSGIICLQMLRFRQIKMGQIIVMGCLLLVAVSAIAYLNWDKIVGRFEDRAAVASAEGRYKQIPAAWDTTLENPLTGLGPGTTSLFGAWNNYKQYVRSEEKASGLRLGNQFHSSILQYFVENGILGGILFTALVLQVLATTLRRHKRSDPYSTIRLAAAASALAYCISTQFGTEINNNRMMTFFICMIAIATNKYINAPQPKNVMDTP